MTMVLWIIGALIATPLAILTGITLTPVKFRVLAQSEPIPRFLIEARPFGGLTPALRLLDTTRPRRKKKKNPKDERKKTRRMSWQRARRMLDAAPDLLAGLFNTIVFERLHVDADFGFENPADTGRIYGQLTPLIYGTSSSRTVSMSLRPDFTTPQLSGSADARLSVTPASLLPPAIRFAWRSFGPRQ